MELLAGPSYDHGTGGGYIVGQQAQFGVIEQVVGLGEESGHDLLDVTLAQEPQGIAPMDVDRVALEPAHQPALRALLAQPAEQGIEGVVDSILAPVADQDGGAVLIVDEAEAFGCRAEVDGEGPAVDRQFLGNLLPVQVAGIVEPLEIGSE